MLKTSFLFVLSALVAVWVPAQSQDPPAATELKLRIVEIRYDDISEKDGWEIKAAYPSVRIDGDVAAEDFDAKVKSLVMKEVERFKSDIRELAAERDDQREKQQYSLNIGFTAAHFDKDIVSIRLDFSEYAGGAHPNHWTETFNYDLQRNKSIELTGLFKSGSNFSEVISRYSIASILQQIKEVAGDGASVDIDWVREGAGPDPKNFERWNITKDGLTFYFDPYQVGPYVLGGFEATVPYRRFPPEMRGDLFYSAEMISFVDGSPPNSCRGGLWTTAEVDFELAEVKGKKNARAYFYGDDGNCPDGEDCRRTAYLIAGDEVIVQREFEGFTCVWFQPAKGPETVGWLKTIDLEKRPDVSRPTQKWVGIWKYATSEIKIEETPGGKLHVYGTSFWQGLGDNVHIGEIDFFGIPENRSISVGDGDDTYDCRVKLRLLGKYLIVSDNLNCGGANVTFNGVYSK